MHISLKSNLRRCCQFLIPFFPYFADTAHVQLSSIMPSIIEYIFSFKKKWIVNLDTKFEQLLTVSWAAEIMEITLMRISWVKRKSIVPSCTSYIG